MPAITRATAGISTTEFEIANEPLSILRESNGVVAMGPMQVQVASGVTAQALRIVGTQGITSIQTIMITSDKSITVSYNGTAPVLLTAGGFQVLSGTSLTTVTVTNATLDTANLTLWLSGTGDPPPPLGVGTFILTGNPVILTADIETTCTAVSSGLIACWDMDELTGTRVDHIGGFNLTEVGTVTGVTGKIRNAAQFVGNGVNRLNGSSTFVNFGNPNPSPWTLAFWVKLTSIPAAAEMSIISKGNSTNAGQYEWVVQVLRNTGQIEAAFLGGGGGVVFSSTNLVVGAWTFVVIWNDGTTLRLQMNNGTIDSAAGAFANQAPAKPFNFGCIGAGNDPLFGLVDSTQAWSRVLSSGERTTIWNGGAGI